MAVGRRQRILEGYLTRCEAIRSEAGFETDAGAHVFLGETPEFGPDDPPAAIAIVVRDDDVIYQGANVSVLLPVEIQALSHIGGDSDRPYLVAERILSDVKRAIEVEDRTLGGAVPGLIERGTTRTLERQAGSLTVGIGLTYLARYVERWGAP